MSHDNILIHQPIFINLGTCAHTFILQNAIVYEIDSLEKWGQEAKIYSKEVKIAKNPKIRVWKQITGSFNQNQNIVFTFKHFKIFGAQDQKVVKILMKSQKCKWDIKVKRILTQI